MRFSTLVYGSLLTLLLSINLHSQEFGEISDEELQMTAIAEDPDADAVILFDKSTIAITPDFDLDVSRHVRIKILTEAGKEWADVSIAYWHEDKILSMEASSYLPNGDEIELDDDNIFDENIKNTKYKKFAIPGVEVGSVIEYQYALYSKYISNLEPWYFQTGEFTKVSEIKVLLPKGFNYSSLEKNWIFHDIKKSNEKVWNPYRSGKKVMQYTWTGKNLPAIRKEPYMNAFRDYYAQIMFQLVSYKNAYVSYQYAKSWSNVAEQRYNVFDNIIDTGGDQLDFIENHLAGTTDSLIKAKKIFEYVRSEIETESGNGWYPQKEPDEVFEDKKGKPSEKNALLLNLLNHFGLKAEPLLISTKYNGKIYTQWAQTTQFNKTIVYLTINNKKYFLDSSNKFCLFGYLTPDTDVGVGFLMQEEVGKIIDIKPIKQKNRSEITTNATLETDGTVSAESNITYKGTRALVERNNIFETSDLSKLIENKLDDFSVETEIDTFYYSDLDSLEKPLLLTIKYKLPAYSEENDGFIYFTPPFITMLEKNPFEKEKRVFPVDYSYKYEVRETFNLDIPKEYRIIEKPKTKKANLANFRFSKIFFGTENNLECRRNYSRKRTRFSVREYPELRNAFDKIVESDQDIIVLEKK